MQVTFHKSGGFAGLVLGCVLDSAALPPAEADELSRLVRLADLARSPGGNAPGGRDLTVYEITVEESGTTIRRAFDDMTVPKNVQPLLDFLDRRARAVPLQP